MTKERTAFLSKEKPRSAMEETPLTLYRVFWVFLIAGVAGDFIEVAFWLLTRGELTSRSSLLYGPFSIVWGAGAVLLACSALGLPVSTTHAKVAAVCGAGRGASGAVMGQMAGAWILTFPACGGIAFLLARLMTG